MIILIILFALSVFSTAYLLGLAIGYGQGYETHMLEGMSKKNDGTLDGDFMKSLVEFQLLEVETDTI